MITNSGWAGLSAHCKQENLFLKVARVEMKIVSKVLDPWPHIFADNAMPSGYCVSPTGLVCLCKLFHDVTSDGDIAVKLVKALDGNVYGFLLQVSVHGIVDQSDLIVWTKLSKCLCVLLHWRLGLVGVSHLKQQV